MSYNRWIPVSVAALLVCSCSISAFAKPSLMPIVPNSDKVVQNSSASDDEFEPDYSLTDALRFVLEEQIQASSDLESETNEDPSDYTGELPTMLGDFTVGSIVTLDTAKMSVTPEHPFTSYLWKYTDSAGTPQQVLLEDPVFSVPSNAVGSKITAVVTMPNYNRFEVVSSSVVSANKVTGGPPSVDSMKVGVSTVVNNNDMQPPVASSNCLFVWTITRTDGTTRKLGPTPTRFNPLPEDAGATVSGVVVFDGFEPVDISINNPVVLPDQSTETASLAAELSVLEKQLAAVQSSSASSIPALESPKLVSSQAESLSQPLESSSSESYSASVPETDSTPKPISLKLILFGIFGVAVVLIGTVFGIIVLVKRKKAENYEYDYEYDDDEY